MVVLLKRTTASTWFVTACLVKEWCCHIVLSSQLLDTGCCPQLCSSGFDVRHACLNNNPCPYTTHEDQSL